MTFSAFGKCMLIIGASNNISFIKTSFKNLLLIYFTILMEIKTDNATQLMHTHSIMKVVYHHHHASCFISVDKNARNQIISHHIGRNVNSCKNKQRRLGVTGL